jgi:hypothetical protein
MVLNTLIYIALVIIVIIVIVLLLRFLFGVLFIMPVGTLLVLRGVPSPSLIEYNPNASNIYNVP